MLVEFYQQEKSNNRMYATVMPRREAVMEFLRSIISDLPFAESVRIEGSTKPNVYEYSLNVPSGTLEAQLKKTIMDYIQKTEGTYGFRIRTFTPPSRSPAPTEYGPKPSPSPITPQVPFIPKGKDLKLTLSMKAMETSDVQNLPKGVTLADLMMWELVHEPLKAYFKAIDAYNNIAADKAQTIKAFYHPLNFHMQKFKKEQVLDAADKAAKGAIVEGATVIIPSDLLVEEIKPVLKESLSKIPSDKATFEFIEPQVSEITLATEDSNAEPNTPAQKTENKNQKPKDSKTMFYVGGAVLATALITAFVMKSRRQ